jgi:hypothetical protein
MGSNGERSLIREMMRGRLKIHVEGNYGKFSVDADRMVAIAVVALIILALIAWWQR